MTQQEGGWPLGLQPLNARIGLVRNIHDRNGSISFGTLLTGSPNFSTASSSDFDTESTGSFFHERSITLGSLLGVSSFLNLSRRSLVRGRPITIETSREQKRSTCKTTRPWIFSLCSKLSTDAVNISNSTNTPSLSQYLEAERRAAIVYRRNQSPSGIGLNRNFSHILSISHPNSLFSGERRDVFGHGSPLSSLSRLCGDISH